MEKTEDNIISNNIPRTISPISKMVSSFKNKISTIKIYMVKYIYGEKKFE